jgi:hypothetical protein
MSFLGSQPSSTTSTPFQMILEATVVLSLLFSCRSRIRNLAHLLLISVAHPLSVICSFFSRQSHSLPNRSFGRLSGSHSFPIIPVLKYR